MADPFSDLLSGSSAPSTNGAADPFSDLLQGEKAEPGEDQYQNFLARARAHTQAAGNTGVDLAAQMAHPVGVGIQAQQPIVGPHTDSAVGNALTSAFHGMEGLGNAGIRVANALGLVGDDRAQQAIQNQLFRPDESRFSNTVGEFGGQIAQQYAFGPAAPGAFALEGAENAKENIEAQQALHPDREISPTGQVLDVLGQAGLQAGVSMLGPGQKVMGGLLKRVPSVGNAVTNAAAKVGAGSLIGGAENLGINTAANAITKYTGVNPDQELGEGSGKAFVGGAIFGGGGQALHELPGLASRLKARRESGANGEPATGAVSDFLKKMRERRALEESRAAETLRPTSESPEQKPTEPAPTAEGEYDFPGLQKRLADRRTQQTEISPADERRQQEDRRFEELAKRATFQTPEEVAPNLLSEMRGTHEATKDQEKPAAGEHPAELADAHAVGKWYADTFKDNNPDNVGGIEAMASMGKGKYKLADVPAGSLDPLTLAEGDKDPAKVEAIKNLSPDEKAKLPPVIAVPAGQGTLAVADGAHRTLGLQAAGEKSVRAYVPEEYVGKNGVTAVAPKTVESPTVEQPGKKSVFAKRPVTEQKPETAESFFDRIKAKGSELQDKLKDVVTDEGGGQNLTAEHLTGPGSIYHEEVKPALSGFADFLHKGKEALKSVFPVETGAGDKNAKLTFRARLAEGRQKTQSIAAEFDSAQQAFDKMTPDAQLDFHRRMYNQEPQPTPELQKISDAMYGHTNDGRQALVDLGHETAEEWEKQKWNMLWKKDSAKAESLITRINRPGKVEGKATFLKKQKLSEFDEGLAKGLVPKFLNPAEQFMATTAERTKYIAGVRAMKDLADVGSITRIGPKDDIPAGWSEVPDGAKGPLNGIIKKSVLGAPRQGANGNVLETAEGKLIAPDGVNRILGNVVNPSLFANGFRGSVFRALQGFNNQATSMLLGVSGFHATKVAKESMLLKTAQAFDLMNKGEAGEGVKGAAGAPLDLVGNIAKGKKIQQQLLGQESATPEEARRNAAMIQGGFSAKSDSTYETQVRRRFNKALQQGGVQGMVRAAAYSPFALNEKIGQEGVFNYVQHNKLAIGASMTSDYLRQNPEATQAQIRENVAKISDHLDNVLGLMERDNLFWNRTARDIATLGTLSVGWNYGSARAAAGGLVDIGRGIGTLRRGGSVSDIDTRRISYLMTMAATQAMGGAVATYLATGKGPQELKDYIFPKNGEKDDNGHDVRQNFGLYTSDYYDFLTNPVGTVEAKASPLIHAATDLIGNKDYRGRPIYDKNDPSDTMHYKMALDIAKHLATTNSPLTFQQIHNAIKEGGTAGKTLPDKLLPWLGVRHAPVSVSQSAAEQAALESMRRGTESREDVDKSDLIRDLSFRVRSKDPQAMADARKAVREGKLADADLHTIEKRAEEAPGLQGMLKQGNLSPQDIMQRVWPKMSPEERKANHWLVRGRIGNAEKVSVLDKQKWFKQIGDDMRAGLPQPQ